MKIERSCNRILNLGCVILLGFLMVLSFLTTQRPGVEASGEIVNGCPIYWDWDNPFYHIIGILLVFILIICCEKCVKFRESKMLVFSAKSRRVFRFLMAIVSTLMAMLLLTGGTRTPVDDQIQVYSAATLFSKGVYTNLIPGGYIEMYPQQLGYTLYLQILFKIFKNSTFEQIQVLNCMIIGIIQYNVTGVAKQVSENDKVLILTEMLSLSFLPLLLLCSWVYGDLPFILMEVIAVRCLLCMLNINNDCSRLKKGLLACAMILLSVFALLFRKNAWIFILSIVIALCIYAIQKKKYVFLFVSVLVMLIPVLMGKAVELHYEQASGYAINGGLPSIMWIAMGITEGASKPGWFSNFSVPIYYETGYNREMSAQRAVEQIQERLNYFKENPWEAISFYKRKIATQWAEPFWGTENLVDVDEESRITGISAYIYGAKDRIRIFLSVWQSVMYIGAFLYCIFVGNKRLIYENIGLIYFMGGFLFSILWEANSRYVLPYGLLLIPYSTVGWVAFWPEIKKVLFERKR